MRTMIVSQKHNLSDEQTIQVQSNRTIVLTSHYDSAEETPALNISMQGVSSVDSTYMYLLY